MSEITTVKLGKDIKNELLAKVNGAQDVVAECCIDVVLHAYFVSMKKTYYYQGTRIGVFESWQRMNDEVLLFTDYAGNRHFFRRNDMSLSCRFDFKSYEEVKDDVILLMYPNGSKYFFRLSDMTLSCRFDFKSYEEVKDDVILLQYSGGSKCFFRLGDMKTFQWFWRMEEFGEDMMLLSHCNGSKSFFRLSDMKSSPSFRCVEEIGCGVMLLMHSNGSKYFFRLSDMKSSGVLWFESSFVRGDKIFLESEYGSVALFDASTLKLIKPWQFE